MNYNEFKNLPKSAYEKIVQETFEEIKTGEYSHFSLHSILGQDRELSIGARMTSRPLSCVQNGKSYSGEEIADIFKNSVSRFKKSFYPLTGDWTKMNVKRLVLFVKRNNCYVPYVSFNISEKSLQTTLTSTQQSCVTDPAVFSLFTFKTVLEITEPVLTKDFPETFLGVTSGKDIYERAFKGSSPNILIL